MIADGFLNLGIDLNVWPWIWIGIAVVFTLIELAFIGGTFLLLPYAVAAFIAALLAFYDVSIEIQWVTFVGGGTVVMLGLIKWVRGFLNQNPLPKGVGADRLIGTTGILTVGIEPTDTGRRGRVIVEGEVWGALSRNDEPIATGSRVRVIELIGTRVIVEPIGNPAPEQPGPADTTNREDET